jgi:hypothetical protein
MKAYTFRKKYIPSYDGHIESYTCVKSIYQHMAVIWPDMKGHGILEHLIVKCRYMTSYDGICQVIWIPDEYIGPSLVLSSRRKCCKLKKRRFAMFKIAGRRCPWQIPLSLLSLSYLRVRLRHGASGWLGACRSRRAACRAESGCCILSVSEWRNLQSY